MFNVWKMHHKHIRKGLYALLLATILTTSLAAAMTSAADDAQADQAALLAAAAATPYTATNIALNPGANESEMRFTWYSQANPVGTAVQFAKKADLIAVGNDTVASTVYGTAASAVTGFSSNKVTINGLQPSTEYVYRVGDGLEEHWSSLYEFKTQSANNFSVMFVGDPQIGASGNADSDAAGWNNTLNTARSMFPNFSFIMSAGDQVNTSTSESEYTKYLSPELLRSIPVATAVGNHDTAVNYKYHFNQPNESTDYGVTSAGGDYYYTYGETLFMVLNTNNISGASHAAFIQKAISEVPNARWKIVTFHQSIYSAANHSTEAGIVNLRAALFPVFDANKIDMVFMGHDHSYVRTHEMQGDNPQMNQTVDANGRVINPNGITYVTANSASGSKYYTLKTTPEIYSDVRSQLRVPTFSMININHYGITVDTYRADTQEKVDTYTMIKTETDGIDVVSPAKLTYTVGDAALDTTGMTVNKTFKGAVTPLSLSDVSITGFDTATPGTKHITVSYIVYDVSYSKTFDIQVKASPVNVKLYAKKGTIVREDGDAEFYLAINRAAGVNTLDATFSYDHTKFKLKDAVLINSANSFREFKDENGTVRIVAAFTVPLNASEYADVVKLIFEPLDRTADALQANVQLIASSTAQSNFNDEVDSNSEGSSATIDIRSYKDICDINGDGKLTIIDLSVAVDHYRVSNQDTAQWAAAARSDVNFDGIVDVTDLTILMVHILKGE